MGLEVGSTKTLSKIHLCFNPAEAEEGFRSSPLRVLGGCEHVSIQPKPKMGLEANFLTTLESEQTVSIQPKPEMGLEVRNCTSNMCRGFCFNPAEAEEGFSRKKRLAR